MRSERVDEMLLVKYLLGELTEEEQVRVEDRAFESGEYLGALDAAEADLIDAYVRGELTRDQRRAFEPRFLVSPQRRSKVEFAKALAQVSDEAKAAAFPAKPPRQGWTALLALFRGWNPVLQFASGTAALLCVAGAIWVISQNAALRSQIAVVDSQQQQLRRQVEEERRRADTLAAQIPKQPSPTAPVAPSVALLMLTPGLSRGANRVERLVVTPAMQIAHSDVQLEARDDYPYFRAELRTRGGQEILTRSSLTRHRAGPAYAISLDVPVTALAAGEYELALKGIPAGGSVEDIGFYYFRVQKQ